MHKAARRRPSDRGLVPVYFGAELAAMGSDAPGIGAIAAGAASGVAGIAGAAAGGVTTTGAGVTMVGAASSFFVQAESAATNTNDASRRDFFIAIPLEKRAEPENYRLAP